MSESIDALSYNVGKLTGQVESLNENMEHLVNWIKESNTRIEKTLSDHSAADKIDFDDLKKKVVSLEKFKARVYMVASICSLGITAGLNYCFRKLG